MKGFFIFILIAATAYYAYENHSPFQTKITDPYYLEIRVKVIDTSFQIVGYGEMNSLTDCEVRGLLMWKEKFKNIGTVKITKNCTKEIPKKYKLLFENKPFRASYIAFDKGTISERNGRFVFYGIPSSLIKEECSKIINKISNDRKYEGKIYCIKGNVG